MICFPSVISAQFHPHLSAWAWGGVGGRTIRDKEWYLKGTDSLFEMIKCFMYYVHFNGGSKSYIIIGFITHSRKQNVFAMFTFA